MLGSIKFPLKLKTTRLLPVVLWFLILSGFLFFGYEAVGASPADDLKENLRQQLDEIQKQINSYRTSIKELQQQGKSFKREIALLDSRIKTVELEIRQTDLSVRETEQGLGEKNLAIGQAEVRLQRERDILGKYLMRIYENDQQNFWELFLKKESLSDVFDEIAAWENIQGGIQESMGAIRDLKVSLEQDRDELEEKREELNQLKVLQKIQKRSLASQQQEKQELWQQTRGQESNYQKLLEKARSDIEAIRQNLYLLEGVGLAMPLDRAYQYAKRAAALTGTRPAYLLAVLKKESSWGEKVGTGNWRKDMRPIDQKAFIKICEQLGCNPDKTPVSRKPSYGWGGAMGPAQFLPSVWLAYEDQVAQLTGHHPPDPWDIEDAFVAAALKLAQAGAKKHTENAEWKAAQVYFAGRNWNNPVYYFYGDQVMELAGIIQEQLNLIGG